MLGKNKPENFIFIPWLTAVVDCGKIWLIHLCQNPRQPYLVAALPWVFQPL